MNTHSISTQTQRIQCEGLDCASLTDKRAKDWFGDVELIDVVDDADRDPFGDITGN
jgi:hypothetical protein